MVMKLTLYGCSGMPLPIAQGDREDCRNAAARRLHSLRADGFPIATLERGCKWEVQEPKNCCLVPDWCGVLALQVDAIYERTCSFCEGEFETEERSQRYCSLECQDHASGWRCGEPDCVVCIQAEDEEDDAGCWCGANCDRSPGDPCPLEEVGVA